MNRSIVQSRTSIFWDVRPTIFLINLQLEDFDLKKCYFLLLGGEKGNKFVCYFFWFKKSVLIAWNTNKKLFYNSVCILEHVYP